jgi:feruloyl-CoA synthase
MTTVSDTFTPPDIELTEHPGGVLRLRSRDALLPFARCSGDWLEGWARTAPDRVFLAEREAGGGWRRLTFGAAREAARSIGEALIERGLSAERPVVILSENGIDHGLLALGALHAGIPFVPVSTAYSRISQDFAKLRHIAELVRPGLVYARDGAAYAKALDGGGFGDAELLVSANPPADRPATLFETLRATRPTTRSDAAFAALGPDTVAKILFTSGSTGVPKGVVNTQRMICSNQQMIEQVWPFVARRPPVLVDWLPWNHTFGGNHNFNLVLRQGGTLYIDEGKPAPGLIERTLLNLRDVSQTISFNVPRGYAILLDHLERDAALRRSFFAELDMIFYAGAALPQSLWERLERLSLAERGAKIPMVSSWGLTETAPKAVTVHFPIDRAGIVGVPAPGVELKLVPDAGKLEMRVRGPNVTPGYWRRADATAAAFDEEGFLRTGDAARLFDPADPNKGIVFDGRVAENFKLLSGTWVTVGELRVAAIAAGAPVIEDAVVTGHDRDEVGLLVFPSLAGCRALCPHLGAAAGLAELIAEATVRDALALGLRRLNAKAGGSSHRIGRALLMSETPSIDANEITDKGYLNQRAVIERRARLVERLYAEPPDRDVIKV